MRQRGGLLVLVAALALGGCSGWFGDERAYYMKREFQRATDFGWARDAYSHLKVDEILPTAKQAEAANEKQICGHVNGQERVITQNGVSDELTYRRCVLAAYPMDGGQRMGNRPDGAGKVIEAQ